MTHTEFEMAVTQYEKLVYTICYQFAKDHHTAQDLAQDTFLAAYTHLKDCPLEGAKPWFSRIAVNKAKDHVRSAHHRKMYCGGEGGLPADKAAMFMHAEDVEHTVAAREAQRQVAASVQTLGEPYNKVATMYFLGQHSVREISGALGRPVKTVQTQVRRAKKQLQNKLSAYAPQPA